MGWYDSGNPPINSTNNTSSGTITAPSTATLIAEIDSTQLGTNQFSAGQTKLFRVTWGVGCSSVGIWQLEVATSTVLLTSTAAGTKIVYSPPNQTAQYVTNEELGVNGRLRIRMLSTKVEAAGWIQAEALT